MLKRKKESEEKRPRFDSDFHSHNALNLPTAIFTLSVLEADLVNLDLTNEAHSNWTLFRYY